MHDANEPKARILPSSAGRRLQERIEQKKIKECDDFLKGLKQQKGGSDLRPVTRGCIERLIEEYESKKLESEEKLYNLRNPK